MKDYEVYRRQDIFGTWLILWKYDHDDYSMTYTDNPDDPSEGGSVRGRLEDLADEFPEVPELVMAVKGRCTVDFENDGILKYDLYKLARKIRDTMSEVPLYVNKYVDSDVVKYLTGRSRKEAHMYNNKIYMGYVNPTIEQKMIYEATRNYIKNN